MESFILIIFLILTFYLVIPGLGAFQVRSRWRTFRKKIIDASLLPMVGYNEIRKSFSSNQENYLGQFRFFGELEAIQGDDIIWLKGGNISLSAEMSRIKVYMLPSCSFIEEESLLENNEEALPDEAPQVIQWERLFSIPEGTMMFISGPLYLDGGNAVFRSEGKSTLTVVIYDGSRETLLRRSIWGGRQRNEYWNPFTPGSLAAGALSLLLAAIFLMRYPLMRTQALVALTSALIPVCPFFPPGVIGFFIFRRLWRRGRFLRGERDLLRLPLRFFGVPESSDATLPDGEPYVFRRFKWKDLTSSEAKLRKTSLVPLNLDQINDFYVFGSLQKTKGVEIVVAPSDPMAEYLVTPGNPETLANHCEKRAKLLEVLAAATFTVGFMCNFFLIYMGFRLLIK
jgi:hypothetical protein